MLSNRNLLSNTRALMKRWRWNSDDVLLHALPVYHVHGLMISFHCAFLGGSTIRFLPSFDAEQVCHELANANVMMGVPTYYTRLLAQASLNRETCQHMRLFISGSAPLQEKTFAEFHRRTGHQILERYGMSETNVICSNPCDGARVPGTVGFPLDHVALRIVDDQQKSMPEGRAGDVQVRGPGVFSGYWRRPELLATEFTTDGYFRTGDVGSLDEEGRLTLSGRSKDLIITGGLNVYPAEIEAYIDQLEGVVESAVIGIPDDDFGERVVAIIVSGSEAQLSGDEIIARLREKLAGYKCPKKVFYRSELPRNTMGKIQKNQLRAWLTKELSRVKS